MKTPNQASVLLTWSPDAATSAYNAWFVETKPLIPSAREPGGPGIQFVAGCHSTTSPSCLHVNAAAPAAGATLFYQVRGVCSGTEAPE